MSTPAGSSKKKTTRDLFDNQESQLRYEAYSRLQAAAVAFGDSCSLPIPEIVAIGGQSDGAAVSQCQERTSSILCTLSC